MKSIPDTIRMVPTQAAAAIVVVIVVMMRSLRVLLARCFSCHAKALRPSLTVRLSMAESRADASENLSDAVCIGASCSSYLFVRLKLHFRNKLCKKNFVCVIKSSKKIPAGEAGEARWELGLEWRGATAHC